jgi:putative cardiolipin synthase
MNALYDKADLADLEERRKKFDAKMKEEQDSVYGRAINTNLIHDLNDGKIDPYFADARVIVDDPQKLLEAISDEQKIVATELKKVLLDARKEVIVFTPYFIPGKEGIATVNEIAGNGVKIILVTNSLATNNHTSVHSAYASYRKRLLDADVELWEARADAAKVVKQDGTTELDHLTLHTKGLIIDRRYIFVGSLNLDPRSIDINTEMGILIDSPDLATKLAKSSVDEIPGMAYRVEYDDKGRIQWRAMIDGREVVETHEPQTSAWMRFKAWFLKIAPENQL